MRGYRPAGPLQAPRSWISSSVLAAVAVGLVGGAGDAAAGARPAPARVAVAPAEGRVAAVDPVAPQPIAIAVASSAPAARPAAAKGAPPLRATRSRTVAPVRPAPVARPSDCSGAGWQQRRGEKALASLRFAAPAGVSITFLPGRGDLKGMTFYERHAVEVYVGSCRAESDRLLRHVVAHELGHAWDSLQMTSELRAEYLAARGIAAGTPWFGCSMCQDFATPAGDFAETYAQWQRGSSDSRSQLARPATPAELQQLSRFFR